MPRSYANLRIAHGRGQVYGASGACPPHRDVMTDQGIEAVFIANRPALARFLAARGGGSDVEDLMQELWLKISHQPVGPIGNPLAYIYRTADNLMLDRRRGVMRRLRRDHEWSELNAGAMPGVSEQPSPERMLIARERLRQIEARLDALGDRTAAIFLRHRVEGEAQRDIAVDLGISLSSVEKHLQKAYRLIVELRMGSDADLPAARRHAIEGVDHDGP